jgi:hypothetical protein
MYNHDILNPPASKVEVCRREIATLCIGGMETLQDISNVNATSAVFRTALFNIDILRSVKRNISNK